MLIMSVCAIVTNGFVLYARIDATAVDTERSATIWLISPPAMPASPAAPTSPGWPPSLDNVATSREGEAIESRGWLSSSAVGFLHACTILSFTVRPTASSCCSAGLLA